MRLLRGVWICMACLVFACTPARKNISGRQVVKEEKLALPTAQPGNNKIIFLTLGMTLSDSVLDTYQFTLQNSIIADGKIPRSVFQAGIPLETYQLYCELSDENKKRIELIAVKNPLLEVLEYSAEEGKLEKRIFRKTTGQIYLRFQLSQNIKYLTIYKPQMDLQTLKRIYHAQI